ncbi:MAG: MaoC family dehydratase N-terminal domain-containing protein [Candidatus Thorarchaeota archaeon]|nr:MAG: MaoC family dehydratase N-terminal domain-containing protein [Candidatus Thorarchaeota archaeon]
MTESQFNRDFAGKMYSGSPLDVTADSIRAYALATNETNTRFTHSDSRQIIAPPFYTVVVLPDLLQQLWLDPDEIGADPSRVVHAQQEMRWFESVRPGDIVYSSAEIANIVSRGRHESLDMIVSLTREDTKLVDMTFRIIALTKGGTSEKKATPPKFEEITRHLITEGTSVVSADQGKRYAKASGDLNPLHTDDEVGRRLGFPGAILHGLCTLAMSTQTIVDSVLDGDPTGLRFLSARFSNPVFMGETLTTRVYADAPTEEGFDSFRFLAVDSKDTPVVTDGIAHISG